MKLEAFIFINGIFLLFSVPLISIAFLILRYILKIKNWYISDFFFVFIGTVYWSVYYIDRKWRFSEGKSLGNLVQELLWISIIYLLLFVTRSFLAKKYSKWSKIFSLVQIPLILIVTFLVFNFTPCFPE